jgi:hypothetical protein
VHTIFLFFSPLDYFDGAPLFTAVSRLRRSSSPISCSTSTAASHCPFLTRSSSSSCTRAAQNVAPAITSSTAVLNYCRTEVPPFFSFAKSTISTTSRRGSLTNFLRLPTLQSPEHHRRLQNLTAPALFLLEPLPPSFPSTIPTTPSPL